MANRSRFSKNGHFTSSLKKTSEPGRNVSLKLILTSENPGKQTTFNLYFIYKDTPAPTVVHLVPRKL